MKSADELRAEILALVKEYSRAQWPAKPFVPGESQVFYAGRVFDEDDVTSLVDSSLDFWLTTGRFATQFEKQLARFVGVRDAVLCNSGSSANLLALSALTSPKLGERALRPGDEVITLAAGFPTTLVDAHTLEVEVSREQSVNEIFLGLTQMGIHVVSLRNKVNRLEEIFMRLVEGKSQQTARAAG